MASCSSRPLGNVSEETASRPASKRQRRDGEENLEQLPAGGWDLFLSHSGAQKGFAKDLYSTLSPHYKVFFDISRPSLPLGEPFPDRIFNAAKSCKVALVVLSNEYFCSKWPMLELHAFFAASGVRVLPLFYELSPAGLSDKEKLQEWQKRWEDFASKDIRIDVSSWAHARHRLCSINGLVFKKSDGLLTYLREILLAIYDMIPWSVKSSHDSVCGRDRLCQAFIDKFEELERRPPIPSADGLSRAYVLGVYGLPGSGKSTLCACLCDHFSSSFAGRALHLKLSTDPTPTELLGIAKELLELTNFGHHGEKMTKIKDLSKMYSILKASNFQSLRVFLVIDNICSQASSEAVQGILQLGVGAESRVMLVARTREILHPLLHLPGKPHNHIHYMCESMTVPSIDETEAICLLIQSAGGTSDYSRKIPSHILTEVARMCAFRKYPSCEQSHENLLYLPLVLKIIGALLRRNRVDLNTQLSKLEGIMADFKELAVQKIVEESYQNLPEQLKLLFLDVALFMVPYGQRDIDEPAVELLGFMHECTPEKIKRRLNELMELCFLESVYWFGVHDVFLEFAKSVPDALSMYYICKRKIIAGLQDVTSDLSSMMARRSTVGLRALVLDMDENCKRFNFPAGLSSVKVVVIRQGKSLEVLGLAGLSSLVSLEIKDCPKLRHADFDPVHAYTLKRVRYCAMGTIWDDCIDVADQQQQGGSFQKSLLQMVQAGWSGMAQANHRPPINGLMNLASQLKALQVLSLEQTGITSLGDLSSCWPQLRVLEVFEAHLNVLELGNLPNLKQFSYGDGYRKDLLRDFLSSSSRCDPKMLRKPKLLAGCPELEEVSFCGPSYEDGMSSLILPPNLRCLLLHSIVDGEAVLLEFSSSTRLLEKINVMYHFVLQSLGFTCQFFRLVQIDLFECPNLITITGLEWLPVLQHLSVCACNNLQSVGNLEALRMLEYLKLVGCPVLTINSPASSSQHLATIRVWRCPNVQFLARHLENLTALRSLECKVSGNMFKLQNLMKLKDMCLNGKCEGQANNPLSLCNLNDDEANCGPVNGNVAVQVQGMKYEPLLVVGEAVVPPLSNLTLKRVQNLVSLDGIHRLRMLSKLQLSELPKLTRLQGLQSLTNLIELSIWRCPAIKEMPSLCSLVNLYRLSISSCENLEQLDLGPDTLVEQLSLAKYSPHLSFALCAFGELKLDDLPKLTCLQGLPFLTNFKQLSITVCPAIREMPSLSSLVNVNSVSIVNCVNLIHVEGLQFLTNLNWLSIRVCPAIRKLPSLSSLVNVGNLSIDNCVNLIHVEGLQFLTNLKKLHIVGCSAIREMPSLSLLVNVHNLSIVNVVNLIRVEGLHNMRSLEWASFDYCENLEQLGMGPDTLEQLSANLQRLSFKGCKFASIQAMVGWVLDEKVSKALWCASLDALTWELAYNLLGKPRERMELAERLADTFFRKQMARSQFDDCFDFQPLTEELKEARRFVFGETCGEKCECFERHLEVLMGKLGRLPLKELIQDWQSDPDLCARIAEYIINLDIEVLRRWISMQKPGWKF